VRCSARVAHDKYSTWLLCLWLLNLDVQPGSMSIIVMQSGATAGIAKSDVDTENRR
jgi:hypothetical protein